MKREECQNSINGFSGAKFKEFKTFEEANAFLEADVLEKVLGEDEYISHRGITAYVDGSYNDKTKEYSCGVVILDGDEVIETFSHKGSKSDRLSMRNVAGELSGAVTAIEYCLERNIPAVNICYDYAGIEKWSTGEWKANKTATKEYKSFMDSVKDKVSVTFTKIEAHTGVKYNEMADRLAKEALGIGKSKSVMER